MTPKADELPRLQARHANVLRFFIRVKDKDDLDACVAVLEPEDVRAQFDEAFKKFGQSLDMMLPDPKALPYVGDARWLGKIRQVAAAKYPRREDRHLRLRGQGPEADRGGRLGEGIQILVKQVSLFTPEFEEKLKALKSNEARRARWSTPSSHEIHVKLEENPVFYTSLRERLEQLIEDRKAKRIDAAGQLKLFEDLRKELRGHADAAEKAGLSETGFAIYGILAEPKPLAAAEPRAAYGIIDDAKRELASLLEEQLEPQVTIVDWTRKDDVQREMRKRIKRQLRAAGYKDEKIEPMAESIVDLLKRRRAR
jgi:type I restriction enzyme R subunit